MLSEVLNLGVILSSFFSGCLQGLAILWNAIIESPILLFLLVLALLNTGLKRRRHY